jgi:hypothetical protein
MKSFAQFSPYQESYRLNISLISLTDSLLLESRCKVGLGQSMSVA